MAGAHGDAAGAARLCTQPQRAAGAGFGEGEGVVADELAGAGKLEHDRAAVEGAARAEFVDDLKLESRAVGSRGAQGGIVGLESELVLRGIGRERARQREFAADVSIDVQLGMSRAAEFEVDDEGRMREMRVVLGVGFDGGVARAVEEEFKALVLGENCDALARAARRLRAEIQWRFRSITGRVFESPCAS